MPSKLLSISLFALSVARLAFSIPNPNPQDFIPPAVDPPVRPFGTNARCQGKYGGSADLNWATYVAILMCLPRAAGGVCKDNYAADGKSIEPGPGKICEINIPIGLNGDGKTIRAQRRPMAMERPKNVTAYSQCFPAFRDIIAECFAADPQQYDGTLQYTQGDSRRGFDYYMLRIGDDPVYMTTKESFEEVIVGGNKDLDRQGNKDTYLYGPMRWCLPHRGGDCMDVKENCFIITPRPEDVTPKTPMPEQFCS